MAASSSAFSNDPASSFNVDSASDISDNESIREGQQLERRGELYVWTKEQNDEFISWWAKTSFYHKNKASTKVKKILWGSKKQVGLWEWFNEGAFKSNGKPRVICKRCGSNQAHGSLDGTTTMRHHLNSQTCQKRSKMNGYGQLTIQDSFRQKVGSSLYNTIIMIIIILTPVAKTRKAGSA